MKNVLKLWQTLNHVKSLDIFFGKNLDIFFDKWMLKHITPYLKFPLYPKDQRNSLKYYMRYYSSYIFQKTKSIFFLSFMDKVQFKCNIHPKQLNMELWKGGQGTFLFPIFFLKHVYNLRFIWDSIKNCCQKQIIKSWNFVRLFDNINCISCVVFINVDGLKMLFFLSSFSSLLFGLYYLL